MIVCLAEYGRFSSAKLIKSGVQNNLVYVHQSHMRYLSSEKKTEDMNINTCIRMHSHA